MSNADPAAGADGKDSSGWKGVVSLTLIAACAALLVSQIARMTEAPIERNRALQATRTVSAVLPGLEYDNEPGLDIISVRDAELLGSPEPLAVYVARRAGRPVGYAITAVAPDGYVGPIRLLIGLRADGTVLAVRTLEHRETPGLGDQIEAARSGWLDQYAGLAATSAAAEDWSLRRDGGRFDALSGATITSRAVVRAVAGALQFYRTQLTELPRVELVAEPDE